MENTQNLLLLEYQLMLQYKKAKDQVLMEKFINSVSEEFEITIDEDCEIGDLLESLSEFDFEGNYLYHVLLERMTPAQKKAAKKRAAKQKAKSKKKDTPKKEEAPKKEAPKKEEAPKADDKPKGDEAPKGEEKPKGDDKEGAKGKDKVEALRKEKEKIAEEIKTLGTQKESAKDDEEESREIDSQMRTAGAKKTELQASIKKEEGDGEKAKSYMAIAKFKKEGAVAFSKWKDVKKEIASLKEADDEATGKKEELEAKATELKIQYLTADLNAAKEKEKTAEGDGKAAATETVKNIQAEIDGLKTSGEETPTGDTEDTEDTEEDNIDAKIEAIEAEIEPLQKTVNDEKLKLTKLKEQDPPAKQSDIEAQTNAIKDAEGPLKKKQAELKKLQGGKAEKEKGTEAQKTKDKEAADEQAAKDEYTKIEGLNQKIEEKKAEIAAATDPKEKAKLKSELDMLSFDKKTSQKKIEKLTGRDIEKEETDDKAKTDKEAEEAKTKGEADKKKSDEDKIKKLEAEVEDIKEKLSEKTKSEDEQAQALMAETDKKAGMNPMLKGLVTKLRLQNRIAFNNAKAAYVMDPEEKKEIDKANSKLETEVSTKDEELEKANKKSEEKAKNDATPEEKKELEKAEEVANKDVSVDKEAADKPSDAPATSGVSTTTEPAKAVKDGESPKQYTVRIAKEKMEKLKKLLADKEAAIKDAPEDKKEGMQKAIDGIKSTVDKAQQAIDDAAKMKESTDADLWTLDAMIVIIENQLRDYDNEYFPLNG